MNGRRVLAMTVRILAQFRRDRRTIVLLFVAPIVILSLLGYLVRGPGEKPQVGIVNQDNGPLGGLLLAQLQKSPAFHATVLDAAQADAALRNGTVAASVVFPPDFSRRVMTERVIGPIVRLEGSVPGLAQTVSQAFGLAIVTGAGEAVANLTGRTDLFPRLDPTVTYVNGRADLDLLDLLGAAFMGLVAFFVVFVVTSVSFLRERSQGTLERMLASPVRKSEIALGYMAGFALLGLAQGAEVLSFALYVLRVHNGGSVGLIFLIEALLAVSAVNLGIFLSMFARTEFQAVQFIPLVIVPQIALSGILLPVAAEPAPLQLLSRALPLTYAVSALRAVMIQGATLSTPGLRLDLAVMCGFCVLLISLAGVTLRRRVA